MNSTRGGPLVTLLALLTFTNIPCEHCPLLSRFGTTPPVQPSGPFGTDDHQGC